MNIYRNREQACQLVCRFLLHKADFHSIICTFILYLLILFSSHGGYPKTKLQHHGAPARVASSATVQRVATIAAKQAAGRSRLPESTVHRFLANLESAGFLKCGSQR
jgi:hypothetical protein